VLSRLDVSAFASTVGRLRYAGAHVLVYEDRAAPEPLDPAALQRLGDLFDRTLYELGVTAFGAESDIDGNGRVIVYLTPVVNALTTQRAVRPRRLRPRLLLRHRPGDAEPELQPLGDPLRAGARRRGDAQLRTFRGRGARAAADHVHSTSSST
jgi:hypothetical protein